MANEYLKRTPTSTGNRRVFTWAGWVKRNSQSSSAQRFFSSGADGDYVSGGIAFGISLDYDEIQLFAGNTGTDRVNTSVLYRDSSSWMHVCVVVDTTSYVQEDRFKLYVNGVLYQGTYDNASPNWPSINYEYASNMAGKNQALGATSNSSPSAYFTGQFTDVFLVDGQALTPDIFGFHKDGKGYISAGTSQSTDFRPGQWVPKSPRIIKSEINRRGGFGVNGFYLPMNSSNNFGADFHCTPDTILRLKEALPQPKAEIDGSGDYTNALRDDPFKQYLVLAIPFVSGGLQNGFGDYSAVIKGSGSPKIITNSNTTITTLPSYYGSASSFNGTSSYLVSDVNVADLNMGSGDYTVESWVRFNELAATKYRRFFSIGGQASEGLCLELVTGSNVLSAISMVGGNYNQITTSFVPVLNQWYHIAQVKRSGVHSLYVDGVCVGINSDSGGAVNFTTSTRLVLGAWERTSGIDDRFTSMSMQDFRIYKGVAKYKGGFDVPKPYTPVGIGTWRAVPDTTANNFATLNPLAKSNQGNFYYTNGNLTTGKTVVNYYNQSFGTIPVSSGKWYWEVNNTAGLDLVIGISNLTQVSYYQNNSSSLGVSTRDWVYASWNGNKGHNGFSSYGSTFQSSSAIIGIALDMDNGTIEFYNNGTSQGIAFSGISVPAIPVVGDAGGQLTVCTLNFGQNPTFSGNTTAGTYTDSNGKGLFKYQPPTGFLALCEDNLPTPVIADPGEHFKTVLWTGDGGSKSITGVGFKPDMVWVKQINATRDHQINDSVRGPGFSLYPNLTLAETYSTARIRSFDSDGFSIGDNTGWNQDGGTYVAWCWKAGREAVTNTDGTITSQVSVNQDAGFSIVSWTGNGSTSETTVGHGLHTFPKFTIIKARDTASFDSAANDWWVYTGVDASQWRIRLNLVNSGFSNNNDTGVLNQKNSGRLTFTANGPFRENNVRYIAYTWAEIEGYSKFGSYVANGSADGAFVYLGFKPAWVMIKGVDNPGSTSCYSSGYTSWGIWDSSRQPTNPASGLNVLWANRSYPEGLRGNGAAGASFLDIDLLSNGFKIRGGSNCENNVTDSTFIFAAFAESPFQTANSK